ncbi:MAG: hypothetical protein Q9167_005880, partial [Letrouitia subvulpina]
MAPKPWILTTPASRGIGLQLARRLLRTTDLPVVATARRDLNDTRARILDGLDVDHDRLHVLKLDVTGKQSPRLRSHNQYSGKKKEKVKTDEKSTDESTIADAARHCASSFPSSYLHLAFCIPGILLHPEKSPAHISRAHALATFETNTIGPLLLIKHFSPFLPRRSTALYSDADADVGAALPAKAVFALMSARVGSISDNKSLGGWYSYRASKAGVNQLARTLDIGLRQSSGGKAMGVSLHPGTVKTGLSEEFWGNVKAEKLFSPELAAERLVEVVKG